MRGKLPVSGESTYDTRPLADIHGVDLHYTAGPPSQTVRAVAQYQTSESARAQTGAGVPFPGLAYTLFVEENGAVYLAHDLVVRVWHNAAFDIAYGHGRNRTRVGICYAGNDRPNRSQIKGIALAIGWLEWQLGRKLEVNGHGDTFGTRCPGPGWPGWKDAVLALIP